MKSQAATNTQSPSPLSKVQPDGQPVLPAQPMPLRPERRTAPRTWETPPAPAPAPHLDDYQSIVGTAEIDELRFLAPRIQGKNTKEGNFHPVRRGGGGR